MRQTCLPISGSLPSPKSTGTPQSLNLPPDRKTSQRFAFGVFVKIVVESKRRFFQHCFLSHFYHLSFSILLVLFLAAKTAESSTSRAEKPFSWQRLFSPDFLFLGKWRPGRFILSASSGPVNQTRNSETKW